MGRLGHEKHADEEGGGWDNAGEGEAAPAERHGVGAKAIDGENAAHNTHLMERAEGATDLGGSDLGNVHGNNAANNADAEPNGDAAGHEAGKASGEALEHPADEERQGSGNKGELAAETVGKRAAHHGADNGTDVDRAGKG